MSWFDAYSKDDKVEVYDDEERSEGVASKLVWHPGTVVSVIPDIEWVVVKAKPRVIAVSDKDRIRKPASQPSE